LALQISDISSVASNTPKAPPLKIKSIKSSLFYLTKKIYPLA
jgi:hypothetical protein